MGHLEDPARGTAYPWTFVGRAALCSAEAIPSSWLVLVSWDAGARNWHRASRRTIHRRSLHLLPAAGTIYCSCLGDGRHFRTLALDQAGTRGQLRFSPRLFLDLRPKSNRLLAHKHGPADTYTPGCGWKRVDPQQYGSLVRGPE